MPAYKHFDVTEIGDVTVVRFRNPRVAEDMEEFGSELFSLVENDIRQKLLLNFAGVEFLNDATLSKMIILAHRLKAQGGVLKLSNIVPNLYEIFAITKLDRYFDIKEDEADALVAF